MKSSTRATALLGIQNKKATFLRRGSPRARSDRSLAHKAIDHDSKHRHGTKAGRGSSKNSDGLVGSKTSPKHYQ